MLFFCCCCCWWQNLTTKQTEFKVPLGGEGELIKMFCKRISPKPTHIYIYVCTYVQSDTVCISLCACMHTYVPVLVFVYVSALFSQFYFLLFYFILQFRCLGGCRISLLRVYLLTALCTSAITAHALRYTDTVTYLHTNPPTHTL